MPLARSSLRLASLAFVALAAVVLAGILATEASARKVANPGNVTASVTGGTFRIKDNAFNLADISPDPTLAGTVAANGDLNFPMSGINFPPISFDGNTVRLQATEAWVGNINPLNGVTSLRARFRLKIEASGAGDSCYVGSAGDPIEINTLNTGTTNPPGPNTPISGTPYSTSDGTTSIVNNSFAVNETASGCGPFGAGNGTVNDTVGLPSAAGNNEARLNLDFNPIVQKGVNASFTVTPSSGPAPFTASFNASGSTLSAGIKTCANPVPSSPGCGYRWDFDGNGSTDTVTNGPTTSFNYANAGTFQARLIIFDNDGDSDTTTRTVTVANRPDLTIDKSHTGNFQSGTQGSYEIDVSNPGAGPTTGSTTVTDQLPAGLSYVSATGTGWSCSAFTGTVTCTRAAAIAAGGSAPTITLTVAVGDAARPSVTNTASVSTSTETATTDNSDSDPTNVDSIDLAVVKSHAGSFRVGRNEDYLIAVTNEGTLPTSGTTTLADNLPQGFSYVSSSAPAGWSCTGSGVTFGCTKAGPIAAGETAEIELTVAVDVSALPSRTNTVTVSTPGDTDPTDDSSSDPTVVVAAPDLSIDKSHTGNFRVGGQGTYLLTVENDGALPSDGTTTVTDSVPAGLPVISASGTGWDCDVTGQDVTCTSDEVLDPDEAAPAITIVVGVDESALPSVINTATVATEGTGPSADPNPANDSDDDPTQVTAIDLTIDKSSPSTGFPIGGSGTYSLAVRNVGTAATVGTTTVTDTLPSDLTPNSATGAGWSCGVSGQDVTCTRSGSIPAGTNAPTISLNVTVGSTLAESVSNTATVSATDDVDAANDSDTDVTTLTAADLELTKSHASDFQAGTTRAYSLAVRNVGTLPTTGTTTVTDTLPAGLGFVAGSGPSWSCGASGQDVTCTRTSAIAAGASPSVITLQVTVGAAAAPSVTNTASVDNAGDRNASNDSDSDPTTVLAADLALSKSHEGDLLANAPVTYEIDVDNVGTADTRSATTVTDTLPAGLTYQGSEGADWSCSASGQAVTCEHADAIEASSSASTLELRARVEPDAGDEIANTATVSVAGDSSAANDSDTDTAGVGRVDVEIDKSHSGDLPRGGRTVYQLAVSNGGSSATTGPVRVTDVLPSGLRYASAGGAGWSCGATGSTVECTRTDPLGGSADADPINLEVEVDENAPTSVTNTATVSTRDDADGSNDSDTDPGTVTPRVPDAALSLRPQGGAFRAGGTGTYTLAVRNVGTAATTGATTTVFTLGSGMTYEGSSGAGWTCSLAGGEVTCVRAASIAPDERTDFAIDVSVSGGSVLALSSATVDTSGDQTEGNDTDSDVMFFTKVDAAASLGHSGSFAAGSTGSLDVGVRNAGSAPTVSTTTLTTTLPAGLSFAGSSGGGWSCSSSGQVVNCEHPATIGAGESKNLGVSVAVAENPPSQAAVSVEVSTADDADGGNDTASDTVPLGGSGSDSGAKIKGGKVKVAKSGKAAVTVSCPGAQPCTGTLALTDSKGKKTLGTAQFTIEPGAEAKVGVKLSKAARRTLAKTGRMKALASAGGKPVKLKLTAAKPKKG